MAQTVLTNKNSDFWKEIRKVKGDGDALPSVIDNMSKDEDISDLFAKNTISFTTRCRSNYVKLFYQLFDRGLKPFIIRYSDDIALVAPTTHALKAMCDICTNYHAHEYVMMSSTATFQLIK